MVMWDVVMYPIRGNVDKARIWEEGGTYFGDPISNFIVWFFVVYVFQQIFAIYIAKFDIRGNEKSFNKPFWTEAVIIYGIQGLSFVQQGLVENSNIELYSSMALVCMFTMIFVCIISIIRYLRLL